MRHIPQPKALANTKKYVAAPVKVIRKPTRQERRAQNRKK